MNTNFEQDRKWLDKRQADNGRNLDRQTSNDKKRSFDRQANRLETLQSLREGFEQDIFDILYFCEAGMFL